MIDDVALREPIGARHPLRIAEAVARLGGRPAGALDELEDAVLALLGAERRRPDARTTTPIPACAPRAGSSSASTAWASGAATTPSSPTSPRGFAGNDRALAQEVGEALLEAGLLAEKPRVGQRHVYLNPRRAAEIRKLIETGEVPAGMRLPSR